MNGIEKAHFYGTDFRIKVGTVFRNLRREYMYSRLKYKILIMTVYIKNKLGYIYCKASLKLSISGPTQIRLFFILYSQYWPRKKINLSEYIIRFWSFDLWWIYLVWFGCSRPLEEVMEEEVSSETHLR